MSHEFGELDDSPAFSPLSRTRTPSGVNSFLSIPAAATQDWNLNQIDGPDFTQSHNTDRLFYFFEHKLGTDVKFMVGGGVGRTLIQAHKLVLASASRVFFSMFYGGLESESTIEIPDCEPDSFRIALEYIYKGVLPSLSLFEKLSDMIYIARKYFLQSLEVECCNQLKGLIQPDTVVEIMRIAHVFDLESSTEACWEFIIRHPAAVLEMSGGSIELDLLTSILRLHKLNISEVNLFVGVKEWAKSMCFANGLEQTGLNLREILGDALQLIRFETMTPEEVAVEVAPTGILTMSEIGSVFLSMNTPEGSAGRVPILFSNVPRQRLTGVTWHNRGNPNPGPSSNNEIEDAADLVRSARAMRRARRRSVPVPSTPRRN